MDFMWLGCLEKDFGEPDSSSWCLELLGLGAKLLGVSGTSGIFTRLRKGHVGLYNKRYLKESHKHLCEEVARPFSFLVELGMVGDVSLSDRLWGLDQVQCSVWSLSFRLLPRIRSMVMFTSKVFFVGQISWSSSFATLEDVCKRRYQLQDIALEFALSSGEAQLIMFSCTSSRASIFSPLTRSNVPSQV